MQVYVGLTGFAGSGKGTVANLLTGLASGHGIQVLRYSLSDEIREILSGFASGQDLCVDLSKALVSRLEQDLRQGQLITRQNLIDVGNDLRDNYGTGILAQLVCSKTERALSAKDRSRALVVVDAIRNPGEVEEFRRRWRERFKLIAVEASEEVRFRRLSHRQREGEGAKIPQATQQADKEIGIDSCIHMSDWRVPNDGTEYELREQIVALAKERILPLLEVAHRSVTN